MLESPLVLSFVSTHRWFAHGRCPHLMMEMISTIETTATTPPSTLNPKTYRRTGAVGACRSALITLPGNIPAVPPNRSNTAKNVSQTARYSTVYLARPLSDTYLDWFSRLWLLSSQCLKLPSPAPGKSRSSRCHSCYHTGRSASILGQNRCLRSTAQTAHLAGSSTDH